MELTGIIHKAFKAVADFVHTHKYAWLVLYFPIYVLTFFIIEKYTPTSGYWVTDLPLDDYIPFVPGFAVFYVIWYPLFVMVGIPTLIRDGEAFKRWMYYLMVVLTGTLIFDVLVPYKFPVPDREIIREIRRRVQELNKKYYVVVRIDRPYC